jgi:hypothetical protein
VQQSFEPAEQLGLRDAQLGVVGGSSSNGRRDSLKFFDQIRCQTLLQLADRATVDLGEAGASGFVQRCGVPPRAAAWSRMGSALLPVCLKRSAGPPNRFPRRPHRRPHRRAPSTVERWDRPGFSSPWIGFLHPRPVRAAIVGSWPGRSESGGWAHGSPPSRPDTPHWSRVPPVSHWAISTRSALLYAVLAFAA